jgi:hypothetical protein
MFYVAKLTNSTTSNNFFKFNENEITNVAFYMKFAQKGQVF